MKWYQNAKISFKIISAFIVVSLIALAIGIQGDIRLSGIMDMLVETDDKTIPHMENLYTITTQMKDIAMNERSLVNPRVTDVEMRARFVRNTNVALNRIDSVFQKKNEIYIDEETSQYWKEFEGYFYDWVNEHKAVVSLLEKKAQLLAQGNADSKLIDDITQQAVDRSLDSRIKYIKCMDGIKKMLFKNKDDMEVKTIMAKENYESAKTAFLIWTILGFIVAIGLGFFISNIIAKPLNKLAQTANAIASGDIDTKVEVLKREDEVGKLNNAVNSMVETIQSALEKTRENEMNARRAAEEAEKARDIADHQQKYLSENTDKLLGKMKEFSSGNLTVSLPVDKDDEIGKLFEGFNQAVSNIRNLITQVNEAVQATASASTQISSSTEELAAGAQEQSAQTTEVASAIEEMTRTIIETTSSVTRASDIAKNSGNIARQGGEVVGDTISEMNKIAEVVTHAAEIVKELGSSSDKIGEIVQVIDDIADQTNLLALNAAIEAARAGEQGRGFAVVADEVRKLAERTTKATKEIASMIKQIQKDTGNAVQSMEKGTEEVNSGKQLTQKAEVALNQIISTSEEVVDNISQVAVASEQQASVAEQISKNIESISAGTHESASGTQQIARAAEDLNRLTENLRNLISTFNIDDSSTKGHSFNRTKTNQFFLEN